MAINESVQYNGGFLPDIIHTVNPMLLPSSTSGNPIKCHEEVLPCKLSNVPTLKTL